MTKLSLLYLPLLLLQSVRVFAGPSSLRRFLDGQDPSHACTADELVDYCPDTGVDQVALVEHCLGEHGLGAAKCYMKYLCEHHNQEAVQKHKDCMDKECPLAKRMPPLDCETYLASLGGATDDSSNQNGKDEEEEESATTEEENTTEEEPDDNNNEEEPEDAEIEDTATVDEEPEETLIEEEVSVDNPREDEASKEQAQAQAEAQAEEKPKKNHRGAKIFFFVIVPILAVLGFFALRGKKEIFPFDAHIESSNTNSLNLTTLTPNSNPNAQIT